MSSSASGTYPQHTPQQLQTNNQLNQNTHGSYNITVVTSGDDSRVTVSQDITRTPEKDDELDDLLYGYVSKDAFHASFYSPPECHPNTRTTICSEISGWIDESASKKSPLLWLNGPVGVGKSVIAKTISAHHDHIIATFFFSTSSDRSTATLIPTLARQLARRIPETQKHIIASLRNSDSLLTSQIEVQFDLLIVQPLKMITTTRPVMVVDGVDECTDKSMLLRFLRVLEQAGERGPGDMPVRFIICSRPEPQIHAILGRVSLSRPNVVSTTNGQEQSLDKRLVINSAAEGLAILGLIVAAIAAVARKGSISPGSLVVILSLMIVFTLLAPCVYAELPSRLSSSPNSEARLPTAVQIRHFLQDILELFRPIRLGVGKFSPSFPASDGALDKVCPHPVISTIQIGLSQECKEDISRYLTDKFNAILQSRDKTIPWFQPSDISHIVEASCGQFLYASTIVRLFDECSDPREVLDMARDSSLPTPDLNKLYKAILTRAEIAIRNQAKEGGPDCREELRFLVDSLAILVFFAGNSHFVTVQKSFPVIETLLGLERGKLTWRLRKMHSVLRIVPGERIEVHHRSFLEFLQNRNAQENITLAIQMGCDAF